MKKIGQRIVCIIGTFSLLIINSFAQKGMVQGSVETITLTAVGDIMVHKYQNEGAYNKDTNQYDFDYMFNAVRPYIQKTDIAIGNLETTMAGKKQNYSGYPVFNTPESLADTLKKTGFDILTTANNHSLDRRFVGVTNTLNELDRVGIKHTGTARTQNEADTVLIHEEKGIKIAFMAYTYGTNGIPVDSGKTFSVNYLDKEKILKDIELAKKEKADLICVSIHFGNEYERKPNATQREWVNFLVENGVDIVLGSHPHVLQEMSWEKDHFVIYSLGNFISSQTDFYKDSSIILNLTISKNFVTGETTIDTVDYIPIWTDFSRIQGIPHVRVMPIKEGIDQYNKKADPLITSSNYKRLCSSLDYIEKMYEPLAIGKVQVQMGYKPSSYESVNVSGMTLVELRSFSNDLGAKVYWDEKNNQAILTYKNNTIKVKPGSKYIEENGEYKSLEVAARKIEGKLFVPMRFISQAFGKIVTYDQHTGYIKVQ